MLNTIGLAMRARKVIVGTNFTVETVRKGRAKVVILANDASANTKKLIYDKCQSYNVEVIENISSNELSDAIGKKNIKVICLIDEGFSNLILSQKRK